MALTVKLQDLLQQNEAAITATSTLIGQRFAILDCTGVDTMTPSHMVLLFSGIPTDWDYKELGEVIVAGTLSETLSTQLQEFCDRRHGRTSDLKLASNSTETLITDPTSLNIFNL